ncbi:hypothetical protein K461DRAFT_321968 [Myriangium duriaei CBS 260.36]|uniref:Uncharacterized protein n=1 Tax=Myriangium duriaei CBS 260.36 TaxID=1168546 RepID=A0A9P4IZJ3_9PEZI|nr:hypothetical protein K461DRAFT_321968 [Myriangium duriaei CBS 260.36]
MVQIYGLVLTTLLSQAVARGSLANGPDTSSIQVISIRDASGGTSISITDSSKKFQLSPAANGNVQVDVLNGTTPTASWLASNNTVLADTSNRLLVYYPTTMTSLGVSRLRLVDITTVPKTSNLLTLTEVGTKNGTSFLLGVDTNGGYYYPVVCLYSDLSNKVFLVKNPGDASSLADSKFRYTVTGGVVSECTILAMSSDGLTPAKG